MRITEYSSCLRKKMYRSVEVARIAIQHMKEKYNIKLHIYPCRYCQGYHLTKMEQKKNARIA